MASESPTDQLLDLLYDELSEDEKSDARSEIEQDEELRAEYESFQQMLSDIDAEMPMVDPPESVHDSLMAAAREQVTESVEESARAGARPPRRPESKGFWGKIASSQTSQIALVATVLLVGAFVFKVMGTGQMDMAPAPGEMAFEERPTPTFQSAEAPEEEPAPARTAADEPTEIAAAEEAENAPTEGLHSNRAMDGERDGLLDREYRRGEARAQKQEEKSQEVAALADEVRGAERTKEERFARAPSKKAKPRPRVRSTRTRAESGKNTDTLDVTGSEAKRDDSASNRAPSKAQDPAAPEAEPAPPTAQAPLDRMGAAESQEEAYRPPSGTIASVEEYYAQGDYRQTVREADQVLSSSATTTQKARALELKAQSYRRMNQLNRSDTIYRNLQQNYPDYAPQRVRQARAEIQRILTQKRRPDRKKSKSVPQYDLELDDAMPTAE